MICNISIIYVYYNTPKEILDSIQSLRSSIGNFTYEIIVIDNASPKPFPKRFTKEKIILIKNEKNVGYGAGLNIGSTFAKGEYLLLVNPDTLFSPHSVQVMVKRLAKDKTIGVLGPQVLATDNTIAQAIGGLPFLPGAIFIFSFLNKIFPRNQFSKRYWLPDLDRSKECIAECLSGVCILVRKKTFNDVNGFDSQFFMYFEEADFCIRVKMAGYRILYYPEAKIMHLGGQSTQDKLWIQNTFQKSRFLFFKKYHGFLYAIFGEFFIRVITPTNFFILSILLVSAFLNLYKIEELMMFFGDIGRDYLAARQMILTGEIPFVGIQSSVVWLHQGPLSIYFIGTAFLLSKFNPVMPAIFYGIMGVFTTFFVFKLGQIFFNRYVGLLASLFFATSPLVVVNTRIPYHSAPIPFFISIFFLVLYQVCVGKRHLLFLLFFVLGLLLQLELSNAVLFFLLIILWYIYKPTFKKVDFIRSFLGIILGTLPFIFYDMTSNFKQTIGFPLWIINRIRLFFGLTFSGNSTTVNASNALLIVWDNIARILFPYSEIAVGFVLILIIFILWKNKQMVFLKNDGLGLKLILMWVFVPILGFIVHTSPGSAYFPFVFPAISILVAYSCYSLFKKSKIVTFLFILVSLYNGLYTVKNEYFLSTQRGEHVLPPNGYNFGTTWTFQDDIARFIVYDAKGKGFSLYGGGFLSTLTTGIDNYKYLVLWRKGVLDDKSNLSYTIFQDKKEIPMKASIVYKNKYFFVEKHEK